ncbi:hypothetical protein KC337_g65 [Hortaea werneckii]|nr:hypothetical protein KC337_g65 [Hortaea werneckii]
MSERDRTVQASSTRHPQGRVVPVTFKRKHSTLLPLSSRLLCAYAQEAHDFPSAHVADQAGMDMVLVGDSLAMHEEPRALSSLAICLWAPMRKDGYMASSWKVTECARWFMADAIAVQEAGAFAVVVEAVPAEVAGLVTKKLRIPTIGIGAGNGCSGQVLVQVDMSGNFPPGRFLPKFVKKFGDVWGEAQRAIQTYRTEVKDRSYPAPEHTYPIPKEEYEEFERMIEAILRFD